MTSDGAARAFLLERGAASIEHPGGTLYAHLCRVESRLAASGAAPYVRLAGLTHAAYSTDGFDLALLPWTDRHILRAVIGPAAEELLYLYASCDRALTWPDLAATGTVHDRFTGAQRRLDPGALGPFVDLTVVNELDVIDQHPAVLGDVLLDLFARWAPCTSPAVAADIRRCCAARGA